MGQTDHTQVDGRIHQHHIFYERCVGDIVNYYSIDLLRIYILRCDPSKIKYRSSQFESHGASFLVQ